MSSENKNSSQFSYIKLIFSSKAFILALLTYKVLCSSAAILSFMLTIPYIKSLVSYKSGRSGRFYDVMITICHHFCCGLNSLTMHAYLAMQSTLVTHYLRHELRIGIAGCAVDGTLANDGDLPVDDIGTLQRTMALSSIRRLPSEKNYLISIKPLAR